MAGRISVILILLLSIAIRAQENRYMVFFKDKAGSTFSLDHPEEFVSTKSTQRRQKQNIAFTETDLPVNQTYLDALTNAGASVKYRTKWFNGALIEATSTELTTIQNLAFVKEVEYVAPGKVGSGGRMGSHAKWAGISEANATLQQLNVHGFEAMHNQNFTGEGILVAVLDTGFPNVSTNDAFAAITSENRILDAYNFWAGSANAYTGHAHGAQVFSILAATKNTFKGSAPGASFLLYATEFNQTEYRVEEYYWTFAAERADSVGADIISSSLGYTDFDDSSMDYTQDDLDGATAAISKAANWALERGILVVVSAGNLGNDAWQKITPPADVTGIMAVGAVDPNLNKALFSSIGPTADNRLKPEVVAIGAGTRFITPSGQESGGNGTSYACPIIAGLAACAWQRWPELSAPQLAQLIIKSSSQYFAPDNSIGFGIPSFREMEWLMDDENGEGWAIAFPNPVRDFLKLNLARFEETGVSINITNPLGQIIHVSKFTYNQDNAPFAFDMRGLAPGLYHVSLRQASRYQSIKVVKLP